ncbi:MAG: cytochrome c [Paracoccaceae bacterium]|nr:MAG: NAD(P)/FAD-dependent oxidoreductase [Alphaproteobacteria bacterium]GIX13730.1 MAG: cytochrome c [Paracoccaceae bacterium]
MFTRRAILKGTVAGAAALAAPAVLGQGKARVVVVGGGAGGATAARYVAKDSGGAIEVTLVEPSATYYTCFFSNLYLGGFWKLGDLAHNYRKLATDYGINVVQDWAEAIDRDARRVRLASGTALPYDRLILSPGIDFVEDSVPGWNLNVQGLMPHAYKAGTQTMLLHDQIRAMREGGVFVMIAPPNPYRCPPGPYERVSMVAHVLKRRNPKAKILILDPKEKFSKQALFEEGWQKHYPGMIERLTLDFTGPIEEVRPRAMEIRVGGETIKADVCNVIPAQKAGVIAARADLVNKNGWAPVVPAEMRSRKDPNIFIIGDASAQGDMPKSGFAANSQAKVAAMTVRADLTDARKFPAKYSNTCWSLIAENDGVKVGAFYEPTEEKIASVESFISQTGEPPELRRQTYEESIGWYRGITADIFG